MLTLDAAGIGDTFHEILFPVQEEQQGRDHIHRGHREGETDFSGVDLGEGDGERLRIRILQEDEGLLHHVRVGDGGEGGDGLKR